MVSRATSILGAVDETIAAAGGGWMSERRVWIIEARAKGVLLVGPAAKEQEEFVDQLEQWEHAEEATITRIDRRRP